MRVPDKAWVAEPKYQALLYFCQLVDDMVWESTRDSHRAPSMNTYHLCVEVRRTWAETQASTLREGILSPILDELRATGAHDSTVKAHFADPWARLLFALKATVPLETKVRGVERFLTAIDSAYLKRCRDEIQTLVGQERARDKEKLALLAGAFCSYIQNVGYTPAHISRVLYKRFFGRDVDGPPVREVQDLFAEFSCRPAQFDVFMMVTEQLAVAAGGRDFEIYDGKLPAAGRRAMAFHPTEDPGEKIVKFAAVQAYDEFGAIAQAEARMALVRAVAYTARPDIILEWQDEAIVTSTSNRYGLLVTERPEPLRQRYRDQAEYQYRAIGERKRAVFETELPPEDANRLKNALLGYANAFHSESPATKLVALWSALEGLLPASGEGNRIDTVVRYSLACQRRLYLRNRFRWSFLDHLAGNGNKFFSLLGEASEYADNLSKFVELLCFPRDVDLSKKLGRLAASSPLTTQRGFRLHEAAKDARKLYGLVAAHEERVGWQLRRIYRERNRIVHRADPSANVDTLILNLNEYLATVFEALFQAEGSRPYALGLDGVFDAILLDEQLRERNVAALGSQPLSKSNAQMILGFSIA